MVPHWFGTKDFVEVTSPSGTTVRIKEGKRRDPFSVVAFATQYPDKATAYFHVSSPVPIWSEAVCVPAFDPPAAGLRAMLCAHKSRTGHSHSAAGCGCSRSSSRAIDRRQRPLLMGSGTTSALFC